MKFVSNISAAVRGMRPHPNSLLKERGHLTPSLQGEGRGGVGCPVLRSFLLTQRHKGHKDTVSPGTLSLCASWLRVMVGVQFFAVFLTLLFAPSAFSATIIDNTAKADYSVGLLPKISDSNKVTTILCTKSALEYLKYAPQSAGAEMVTVPVTSYRNAGGSYKPLPHPVPLGSAAPLDISSPVKLIKGNVYHAGEPVFLRLTDEDRNIDTTAAETIELEISVNGEKEILRLSETGPDTGVFVGYIQSTTAPSSQNNGLLSVTTNSRITAKYAEMCGNAISGTDTIVDFALVDPFGVVFDSLTGELINGATVTLLKLDPDGVYREAIVYGDDGVSRYPFTVITGATVSDSSGVVYIFSPGQYRFPYVAPGSYRLVVTPPANYTWPSAVSDADLRSRFSFEIVVGSKGQEFLVDPGPALNIDIPVDPLRTLLDITKTASKASVSIGDFIQYKLTVKNTAEIDINNIMVNDRLPLGFRYRKGSTKINGVKAPEPSVSADGRSLVFSLGNLAAGQTGTITYVVEVAAGAKLGRAINFAAATGDGGVISMPATAEVLVKEDLFGSKTIIMGRVFPGCKDHPSPQPSPARGEGAGRAASPAEGRGGLKAEGSGVSGVRIYLEDGAYVVTDKNGMFHFEGIKPGTHVVQLDVETIPEGYELISCEENSRYAGASYSQFVDLQGGTMWRADFYLAPKPKVEEPEFIEIKSEVAIELNSVLKSQESEGKSEIEYEVLIHGGKAPLKNLRLSVMLPDGLVYIKETGRLGDSLLPEPQEAENVLTYRLGDVGAGWKGRIKLHAAMPFEGSEVELVTKALLTFDTEGTKNRRTPLVDNALARVRKNEAERENTGFELKNIKDSSGLRTIGIDEKIPNKKQAESLKDEKKIQKKTMPEFDSAWLNAAKPGLDWAWPQDGYYPPIPSIKIAVKHDPAKSLRLLLNGKEVEAVFLDGTKKRSDNRLAVSLWIGIHINDGENLFEAVQYNPDGIESSRIRKHIHYSGPPVKAALIAEKSGSIADGKTPPVIAVRLTDKDGHPAREGVIGEYKVDPPYLPFQKFEDLQKDPLAMSKSERMKYVVGEDGIALIELMPTSQTGEAVVRFNLVSGENEVRTWLTPGAREWILVGLAEGTVGYNTVSGNMESFGNSDADDKYYKDGRFAFFAKGMIKGKWLLTAAYDSDKNALRKNNSLHGIIDPDKYYTLYGDATQQQYDAASARALYVKIERDRFYALFGDYATGLTVTELSRYSRNLNGFKSEMKGERFDFNVFVSDTNQAFVKDEIRGDGTSGLYRLSRKNIVMNSESVSIETRDRFRSEEIISSAALGRHIDYNIDYDAGTIYFKSPVYSRDENFNPVYIIVRYESFDPSDMSFNYGGRGALRLLDNKLEIGATHIHEGRKGGEGNLTGIDAKFKLDDKTSLRAEFAATDTDFNGLKQSGNAYLAEVIRRSEKLEGKVYVREQESEFGLGQQSGSEAGTRKIGFNLMYRLSEKVSFNTEAFRQYNLTTDAVRDMAEVQARYNEKQYELHGGLRHAKDTLGNGDVNSSEQLTLGGSYRMLNDRLILRLKHDQSLFGNNENADYPTRTTIGADYKLNETAVLFVAQEFTQGENEDAQTTRLGLKASPWKGGEISSSLERQYTENGARLFSVNGLKQTWQITKKWSVDAGLDRSKTLKHPGNIAFNTNVPAASGGGVDFTAVSLGAAYREEKWSWAGRAELRESDGEDKIGIFSGVSGEFNKWLGLAASVQFFKSDEASGEKKTNGNLRFGFAYRPDETDWIILYRLDYIFDKQSGGDGDFVFKNNRIINNLNANYKVNNKAQLSLQYGAKYVTETIDGDDYSGYTDLMGVEGRYDITKKWDLGLRGSALHSWKAGQFKYSAGFSIGYNFIKNMWVSAGYNFTGFSDRDFSKAEFTSRGPYVKFRMKFDQWSVKDAVKLLSGQ